MARKKRLLDDGDSDSSIQSEDDFDFNDNPNTHRKRRRKEDAIYGVFGDDSEDEGGGRTSKLGSSRSKAPAFVASDKKVDMDMDVEEDATADSLEVVGDEDGGSEGEDDQTGTDNVSSDDSEPSRPPSPRIHRGSDDEEDGDLRRPGMGAKGIGTSTLAGAAPPLSHSELLGGTGFASRGGIGSSRPPPTTPSANSIHPPQFSNASEEPVGLPSSFGESSRRSFIREVNSSKSQPSLSATEMANFHKISGSFGARMLAKMGWQVGTGLGTTGEGIVTPVESKLRPQKMGIAFKGFKEKTEQSKMEARRRGEVVSEDEDMKARKSKKGTKEHGQKRSDVWKKPKKVKTKLEHKTYEQILAEAGHEVPATGIGQIIDATGAVVRFFISRSFPTTD